VGVAPVLVTTTTAPHASIRPAIARTVKNFYEGSIGSLARRSLAHVKADNTIEAAIFATKTALAARVEIDPFGTLLDRDLLTILSNEHEFRSHVVPDWTLPVGEDEALDRMARWIVEAGFAITRT
jgi:hypothetical protein